jgi:hypothetical protein
VSDGESMTIEWLNSEMTEAIVTRGFWRKERAHVRYVGPYWHSWEHVPSANSVRDHVAARLHNERVRITKERDWQPVRPLPKAKVMP